MNIRQPWIFGALVWGVLSTPVWAQGPAQPQADVSAESPAPRNGDAATSRKAEHERIRRERDAVQAQRLRDESACYQRFAVEDCLRGVRAQARDAQGRLRTQEIELNDAERKEKAAERLQSIEEKQRSVPPPAKEGEAASETVLRNDRLVSKADGKTQRDHDAAARAAEQRTHVQKQAQEQAARAQANAQRSVQARAQHERALQAAQERRARAEKARADAAAQGRKPAAPLPASSASAAR